MYSNSRLKRNSDGKVFRVTLLSHWSDIQSEDGQESDCVKWVLNDYYVSQNQGHGYTLLK
jgi:hypothetical protein